MHHGVLAKMPSKSSFDHLPTLAISSPCTLMPTNRSLSELTREQLYHLIWSQPATKVAEEFGISGVAVAKHCRKLNIPRPYRGYWAKLVFRHKPKKTPLPPAAEVIFAKATRQPVEKALSLPEAIEELHPKAAELLRALKAAKADEIRGVHLETPELPEVIVTKNLAERVAKAFDTMIKATESLGIPFSKSQSKYYAGYFRKGNDRMYFKIEEELVVTNVANQKHWRWQTNDYRVPSGNLCFILNPDRYGDREAKRWVESKRLPLEKLLAKVVRHLRQNYIQVQRRRAKEAIERAKERVESAKRHQEWLEKEAIRLAEAQKREHAEALEAVIETRKKNLLKAAEWWRIDQVAQEFILACEKRWRSEQGEQLNPEQEEWLRWARQTSSPLSPFSMGYPEPANDGPFDPTAVPFGGPYPQRRKIPSPPTMPVIPPPVANASPRHFP